MKTMAIRIIAAITLIVSFFLPWVTSFFFTLSAYEYVTMMFDYGGEEEIIGAILLVSIPISAIFTLINSKSKILVGLTILISTPGALLFSIQEQFDMEFGFYLTLLALITLFITLFFKKVSKNNVTNASVEEPSEVNPANPASSITPQEEKATTSPKFCTDCGEEFEADAKFCTSCGTKRSEENVS